jgi:HAD superfamily hydrolase (TIGR01509 family)
MGSVSLGNGQVELAGIDGPLPPRAAIFDCDGLLVDTQHCWHAAYRAVATHVGCPLEELPLGSLNGASVDAAAERLSVALGRPISSRLIREALETEVSACPHTLLPGAMGLLGALRERVPLAVASNAPLPVVEAVLIAAGARGFFREIVTPEAVPAAKPSPDVYLEACFRLCVDPSTAIAFEDSAVGAEAARAAGIRLVAVPSQPGAEIEAQICAERLDDHRILALFGVVTR